MLHFKSIACAAVCVGCAVGVAAGAPVPYRLDVVAETAGGAFTRFAVPSINDLGVVAFHGNDAAGNGGVFYGVPGAVQQLPTPGLTVTPLFGGFGFGPLVGVNNAGRLAFTALPPNPNQFDGIDGVYTAVPLGPITTVIARTANGDITGGPAINSSGVVVVAHFGTPDAVLVGDGSAPPVEKTRTSASFGAPHINDSGQVAVTTRPPGGPTLFFDDRIIITGDSPYSVYEADVANDGRVLFSANSQLFIWDEGAIHPVAGSGDNGLAMPAFNDLGGVAALSEAGLQRPERLSVFMDGGEGVVLAVGDPLLGSTVSDLAFVGEGFNDAGQLAVLALLQDGRQAVVRASPIPEPTGLGLATMTVGGVLMRVGRSRRLI